MSRLMESLPYTMKWLFTRVTFYPSLMWNLFNYYLQPFGKHDWWNRIDNYLLLGALPSKYAVSELYKEGVRGVINTCDEYTGPISTYEQYGIKQL